MFKYNILLIFAFFSDLKMPPRKKNRFLENTVGAQTMVVIKTKKYGESFMKMRIRNFNFFLKKGL